MTRPTTTGKAQDLITFTRSTTGTYLDSVTYGNELVTNGTFDTDSDWDKGSNWTLGDGVATSLGINAASAERVLSQASILTVGKTYTLSVAIDGSNVSSAFVNFNLAAPSTLIHSVTSASSGIYVITFVATSTTLSLTTSAAAGYSGNFSIDNVSVKELTGGQGTQGTPLLRTSAINKPRIEYDASGNCLGLLVEEARTNIRTYSEDFSNGVWAKSSSASLEHGFESLDGGTSASKLTFSETGTNQLLFTYATQTGVHSFSIYMKAGEPSDVGKTVRLDSTGGGATGKPITLTNEWQRVSISPTPTGYFQLRIISSGGMTASSVLLFGAQLETGSFPTSYIPTSGSAVTRAADVASLAVSEFGYNQDQGTVVAEAAPSDISSGGRVFSLNDGTGSNVVRSQAQNSNHFIVISGGAVQGNIDAGTFANNTFSTLSGAYKQNDIAACIDGGAVVTDTSATIPTITNLSIGQRYDGNNKINGHIKSIQYYPLRLSNAQLQALTV